MVGLFSAIDRAKACGGGWLQFRVSARPEAWRDRGASGATINAAVGFAIWTIDQARLWYADSTIAADGLLSLTGMRKHRENPDLACHLPIDLGGQSEASPDRRYPLLRTRSRSYLAFSIIAANIAVLRCQANCAAAAMA